jgi:hypothetical protein
MTKPSVPRTGRDGCGFALGTIVFTCLLLVLNGILIQAIYHGLYPGGPPSSLQKLKAVQLFLFIGPVLLLFVEWTLFDFGVRRMLLARRDKQPKK